MTNLENIRNSAKLHEHLFRITNVEVVSSTILGHECKFVDFELYGREYTELLEDDGSLCVSDDSNLVNNYRLTERRLGILRELLQKWLEDNNHLVAA